MKKPPNTESMDEAKKLIWLSGQNIRDLPQITSNVRMFHTIWNQSKAAMQSVANSRVASGEDHLLLKNKISELIAWLISFNKYFDNPERELIPLSC